MYLIAIALGMFFISIGISIYSLSKSRKIYKLLEEEVENFNNSGDKNNKNNNSIVLFSELLDHYYKTFRLNIICFVLIVLGSALVFVKLKPVNNYFAWILGIVLFYLIFLFVFIAIEFDHKKKIAVTFTILSFLTFFICGFFLMFGTD